MVVNTLTPNLPLFTSVISGILPVPKQLWYAGEIDTLLSDRPKIAIVGSRNPSAYGRQVCRQLTSELSRLGAIIISGLALGIDAEAHATAIESNGHTWAVLPGPLTNIYPRTNSGLAQRILDSGGGLLSEYPTGTSPLRHQFIARNRIIAGLSDATLIIEAAERSGSLHTARFCLEMNKPVLAVPGNITSPLSQGTNNLIKAGALMVTEVDDVLHAIGYAFKPTAKPAVQGQTTEEQIIIDLLTAGVYDGPTLLAKSALSVQLFQQSLTMLEIQGVVRQQGGDNWMLG